jgi:YidC/Oxa1 family membrane protein insertase
MNKQPPVDIKNVILAVVLSMIIIFGWQHYFVVPQQIEAKKQAEVIASAPVAADAPTKVEDRATLIAANPRVKIQTDQFEGSINLAGAQLDDLRLLKYRETVDPKSPAIVLLSPSGAKDAYYVEQGLRPLAGDKTPVPDSKTLWTAPQGAVLTLENPLTLTWDNGAGLSFQRTFSISDNYLFDVKQTVTNKAGSSITLYPYARVQRQDTPHVSGYWVFFEGLLGVHNSGLTENHYSDLKKKPEEPVKVDSTGGWLGFTDKYWATMLIPDKTTKVTNQYEFVKIPGRDGYQASYISNDAITVAPGATASYQDHIFAGVKIVDTINVINTKYGFDKFDLMIDWGWFSPITKTMFYLLEYVKGIVGNFGIAILIVTVLVKLAVFPIANKAYASMSKMKKLKPQMDAIKEKYPDDRTKVQQETMELYKREKLNPMAGCLPMFIQIPIFFSLYKVILTTIELRHAPFYGWIHDLSAADPTSLFNLFGLIPWQPWPSLMIGVWPILMGITMWVQMRLNPTPNDPVQETLFNWMPVLFTFMLGTFPVGLVIYWTWSNTLSVIQQSYIMKKNGAELDLFGNIRDAIPFLRKKPATPPATP